MCIVSAAVWLIVLCASVQTPQEAQCLPPLMHSHRTWQYKLSAMTPAHHLTNDMGGVGASGDNDNQSGKAQT